MIESKCADGLRILNHKESSKFCARNVSAKA